jgi:hypothetical protein
MSYGREFHFPLPLLVGYLSEFSCPGHIQIRRLKHAVFFPCCFPSVCLSVVIFSFSLSVWWGYVASQHIQRLGTLHFHVKEAD